MFGQFSLLTEESPTSTVRAHEDTLCYLIGPDVADEVLGTSAGQLFVLGRMRERLAAGFESLEPPGLPFRPVGGLVRRAPVTADPGMSVDGSGRTDDRRARLVPARPDARRLGHRHRPRSPFARAGVAPRAPRRPVEEIATFPVKTLPEKALVGEALLAMFAEGVHHFPVTRPDGSIAGVITDTDLMDIGRDTPFSIRSAIERAQHARRGRGRGPGAPAGRPRPGRRQLRAGRRRPRRGARRGRDDHAAAHARDRALRRASGRRGRGSRSGAPPGANRRSAPTRITRSPRRVGCAVEGGGPVLRRAGGVRHGRSRGGRDPAVQGRRDGDRTRRCGDRSRAGSTRSTRGCTIPGRPGASCRRSSTTSAV